MGSFLENRAFCMEEGEGVLNKSRNENVNDNVNDNKLFKLTITLTITKE